MKNSLKNRPLDLCPYEQTGRGCYAPDTRIKEHPVQISQGEWTAVYGIMEGTFTKPMTTADQRQIVQAANGDD